MKATGVVRKIDQLGRYVLPKELRRQFDISEGDALEVFIDGDKIILKKYSDKCMTCHNSDLENLKEFNGKKICKECINKITKLFK